MTTPTDKGGSRELRPVMVQGAMAVAGVVLLLVSFFRGRDLAERLVQTSDSTQGFVAGHALASGNLLLHGWRFPLNNYYFTDTLPYAVLETMFGGRPSLLALEPALLYLVFVLAALVAGLRRSRSPGRNLDSTAVLALLLAAPVWIGAWNPLFLSDMHVATAVGALVVLMLASQLPELKTRRMRIYGTAGIGVLTAAIVASDPFSLVFGFGPALVVLSWDTVRARAASSALAALAVGVVLGSVLPRAVAAAGGFTIEYDVVGNFVEAPLFARNLAALLGGLLRDFGIVVDENSVSARAIALLCLRGAGFAVAIAAVIRAAGKVSGNRRASRLDRMLGADIVVLLAACAASAQFGKGIVPEHLWEGGPPMRYLVPAYMFGVVLGARSFPDLIARCGARTAAVVRPILLACATIQIFLGGLLSDVGAQPRWIGSNAPASVAYWLEHHGLFQGVGEYWTANLVTALSGDRVRVCSVVSDQGRLAPYIWVEDSRWYRRPPEFVIWQEPNKSGVSADAVRATYKVCQVARVAGYLVAVLDCPSRARRLR